jgi:hypothetical protein
MNSFTRSILGTLFGLSSVVADPARATAAEQERPQAQGKAATLEEKIAQVLPKPSEDQWMKIPWRSDLAQARAEANREGKPIFLWMMNGNPLGCT